MKRIGFLTIVFFFWASLQAIAQTTSTTASNSAPKPSANSTSKPSSNSTSKPVIYLEGTGTVQRTDGFGNRVQTSDDKWPSPSFGGSHGDVNRSTDEAGSVSGAGSSASQPGLRCRGPERRPCEERNVAEMSRRLLDKRAEHPALADIRHLQLKSSAGALSCEQANGAPCSSEQIRSLNEHVAQPLRCEVYFGTAPANRNYTSQNPGTTAQNNSMGTTTQNPGTTTEDTTENPGTTTESLGSTIQSPGTTTQNAATSSTTSSTTGSAAATTQKTQNNSSTAQNHPSTAGQHPGLAQHHTASPHHPQPPVKQN